MQNLHTTDELGHSFSEAGGDVISRLRTVIRGSGEDLLLRGQLGLYRHLAEQQEGTRRWASGVLANALLYKIGSEDAAYGLLDFNGSGELSLTQLAGGMGLLGLDTEVLCGLDEQSLFRSLDPKRRGAVALRELLGRSPPPGGAAPAAEADGAWAKWALVGRWMAVAARRSAALREQRLLRGWRLSDGRAPAAGAEGSAAEAAALAGAGGSAAASPASAPASRGAAGAGGPRCNCRAVPEQVLLETAAVLRQLDRQLRALFNALASPREEGGSQVVSYEGVYGFFSDLHLVDPMRNDATTQGVIDKHFAETLALQVDATKVANGLLFWSFKAFLNNVTKDIGFGWDRLVEFTIELSASGPVA